MLSFGLCDHFANDFWQFYSQSTKKYLWLLKKTFIISEVRPFFNNLRKELTKRSVFYFNDLGLRNYVLSRLDQKNLEINGGFLFQNLVFFLIRDINTLGASKINYWRTMDGAEVDFVLNSGAGIWPIEVKYSNLREIIISRSMKSFVEVYHPQKMTVVNLSLNKTEKIDNVEFEAVPVAQLHARIA